MSVWPSQKPGDVAELRERVPELMGEAPLSFGQVEGLYHEWSQLHARLNWVPVDELSCAEFRDWATTTPLQRERGGR